MTKLKGKLTTLDLRNIPRKGAGTSLKDKRSYRLRTNVLDGESEIESDDTVIINYFKGRGLK